MGLMHRRGIRSRRAQLWLLLVAAATLATYLLSTPGVAGAEESADAGAAVTAVEEQGDPTPEDSSGGVEVVRYAGSDPYGLSIELARALANAKGGTSEWVVLALGESWADAVTAGPLAASLDAPVVLVPPGGLQTATARSYLVEFLRSSSVRRVAIVGSPDVLPNHEPSVLFGWGCCPATSNGFTAMIQSGRRSPSLSGSALPLISANWGAR